MGQPLFVYAFWELRDGENRQLWKSYCIIVLMALLSSPILVGYADVLIALAVFFFGKKRSRHYLLAWGLLVSIYIFCNFHLLSAMLGGMEGFVSHKVEFMPEPMSFLKTSVRMFVKGHYHPTSNHFLIIPFSALVLTWSFLLQRRRKQSNGNVPGILFTLLLCAAAIAVFLWIVALRFDDQAARQNGRTVSRLPSGPFLLAVSCFMVHDTGILPVFVQK